MTTTSTLTETQIETLYDLITAKVQMTIHTGQFNLQDLRPIVLQVVELVQTFSQKKPMTGPEKQQLALQLVRHVLKDLCDKKVLTQEMYEQAAIAIEFAGPALIDGMKALYKQIISTATDIQDNGCAGCCRRNF